MSTIESGKRGRTIVMDPKSRIRLSEIIKRGLDDHTLTELAEASTLSPETVRARAHDHGRANSGSHMSVWSLVALAEGMGLEPNGVAKQLGVELGHDDIVRSQAVVALRRLRHERNGGGTVHATMSHSEEPEVEHTGPSTGERFAELLVANVIKRLEPLIEDIVERKVIDLLASV